MLPSDTLKRGEVREALVFKLLLNGDTLAYMYYSENGGGDPCASIFKFSMWGYKCIFRKFLNAIFPFFLFFSSDIPISDAVVTAPMRKL